MSKEEMVQIIFEKAIKNGFEYRGKEVNWLLYDKKNYYLKGILFSHDFAKAFWKNTNHLGEVGPSYYKDYADGWKFHLENAVISPDPIKYYYEHLYET